MASWKEPSIYLVVLPTDTDLSEMGVIDWPEKMELELTGHTNKSFSLPHVYLHLESDNVMSATALRSLIDFQRAKDNRMDQLDKIAVSIAHVQIEHWQFNMCRGIKLEVHNKTVERPPVIGQTKPVKMMLPTGWTADIDFYFESYYMESRNNPAVKIEPYKRFDVATDIPKGDVVEF